MPAKNPAKNPAKKKRATKAAMPPQPPKLKSSHATRKGKTKDAQQSPLPGTEQIVPIADLVADPRNARYHSEQNAAAIRASLQRFGAGRSIVLDKDGMIRAGHGTVEAAKEVGLEKVRIIEADKDELIAIRRADWTEEEATGYAIADNRTGDLSSWNEAQLRETIAELEEAAGGDLLDSLGFDETELAGLLEVQVPEPEPEPKEKIPPKPDPKTTYAHLCCPECGHEWVG